eukprot:m51a1_g1978 hypothetical protein (287) ;mRNA; r:1117377-1118237
MTEPVRRVALLYYSLTGNTRHIAELLRDALVAQGFEASTVDITSPNPHQDAAVSALAAADAVGVASATIGLREPTDVRLFLDALPASSVNGKPAIVFCTAGDNEGRTLANIASALGRKGAVVVGSFAAYAPNNYIVWGEKRGSTLLWGSRERNKPAEFAKAVAPMLRSRAPTEARVRATLMGITGSWLGTDAVMRWVVGKISVDRNACIGCHLCVRQCPTGALDVEDAGGVPVWNQSRCMGCCRCINYCPKNCINSLGTAGKQQWTCKPELFADGDFATRVIEPSV